MSYTAKTVAKAAPAALLTASLEYTSSVAPLALAVAYYYPSCPY